VRTLAPCSCQEQALGPRLRGDDEPNGVTYANFRNEVLVGTGDPDNGAFVAHSNPKLR